MTNEFKNLMNVLEEYSKQAEKIIKNELISNNRVASGKLLKSINTEIKFKNLVFSVVLNAEDYFKFISEGRGASKNGGDGTLQEKILEWIKVKNILPREVNGNLPTEQQLAFLIARKIHRVGYKGSSDYETSLEQLNQKYLPLLTQALQQDFEDYSYKIFLTLDNFI